MQMKLFYLVLVTAFVASGVPVEGPKEYSRFFEFTDVDGIPTQIDLEEEPDWEALLEVQRNPADNAYYLFTRRNPTAAQTLVINNAGSITNSNFNRNHLTVVVAHGWLSDQGSNMNPTIRDALLQHAETNVIIIDWRRLALKNYITAANGVPAVGAGLGQFLRFLSQVTGQGFNQMHLVGFSLGAHLVGNAGRELDGQVARITALDPAGPLWVTNSNKVKASDARYVEGIHTDGNTVTGLGLGSAVGNVDFFPNGGNNQPGCITGICDHNRAWELFAATINYDHHIGRQCSSNLQITWNSCRGSEFPMGNTNLGKSGSGKYRLNTGRRFPFEFYRRKKYEHGIDAGFCK